MNILVIGANGQLGCEFQTLAKTITQHNFYFATRAKVDLSKADFVTKIIELNLSLDVILNCAAYTKVDQAESEITLADTVNAKAVNYLGQYCQANNIVLVHFSTDYVFDGNNAKPNAIDAPKNPLNVYGKTKLEGEIYLQNIEKKYILRTSWVYSTFGTNFIKTMLKLAETKNEINVVADQIGRPTYAKHLATATLEIIENKIPFGIYHYCNLGTCSWFELATAIFEITKIPILVNPINSDKYVTAAKRPANAVLDLSRLQAHQIKFYDWRDALKEMLYLQNSLKT